MESVVVGKETKENIEKRSQAALLGISFLSGFLPITAEQYGFTIQARDPLLWITKRDAVLTLASCLGGGATIAPMGKKDFPKEGVFVKLALEKYCGPCAGDDCGNKPTMPLEEAATLLDQLGFGFNKWVFERPGGDGLLLIPTSRPKGIQILKRLEDLFGPEFVVPAIILANCAGRTFQEEIGAAFGRFNKADIGSFVAHTI